jgi:hypothetical protein
MNHQALQYYMHDGPTTFRFELAGNLNCEDARRIEQDWRVASSVIGDRRLVVDMTFVTSVDEWGRALLARWHRDGAQLVANSKTARALAESILGEPLAEPTPNTRAAAASDGTWRPFRTSFLASAVGLSLLLYSLACPVDANAATLKSETVAAWEDYLQTANANLQDRVRPGGRFLWTFEDSERAAKVRGGEIVVAPAPGQNPKKVSGGLIHHWMGAVYLPNLKLQDVLAVTTDYDHYQVFYRPSVRESKTVARNGSDDQFSMLLMNKAFFMTFALDADYQATNVRLDDHRFYSISRTTRVQEVDDYGRPRERRIPEGEGGGYIWKLCSIARFEQRDNGVYFEMEATALSREIPAAARFLVDPIVRHVSRNALFTSLQQTEEALRANCVTAAKPAVVPASAEQLRGFPASLSNDRSAISGTR